MLECGVELTEEGDLTALSILRDYFHDEASMHLNEISVSARAGMDTVDEDDGSLLKALVLVLPYHNKPENSLKTIRFSDVDFTKSSNFQSLMILLGQQKFWKTMLFDGCQFWLRDASSLMDGLNIQTKSLCALEVAMCTFAADAEEASKAREQELAHQALSSFLTAKDSKLQHFGIGHSSGGDWFMGRWQEHVGSVLQHSNLSLHQLYLKYLIADTHGNAALSRRAAPYLRRNVLVSHVQKSLLLSSSSFWAAGLAHLVRCDWTPAYMAIRGLVPRLVDDE